MAGECVLIIDDSSHNIKFLAEYVLGPHGYRVLTAHDGESGLVTIRDQQPDLILLEMSLPKMSGVELLHTLSTEQVNTPVIVMTFHGSETLAVQAFRMGVKDYVLKPFDAAEMVESVERALTEVRLRRERDELTRRLLTSNKELERRVKELHTLFGIGKSVTAVLNQEKVLSRLVEAAIYLTGAEAGSLMLLDDASNELYMVAARGIDDRVARAFRLRVDDSMAGEVITSGQPFILSGQDLTKIKTAYLVRSLMYVPLKIKGRVSGVLTVENRLEARDFTNHDLRLLSALADYAAISIENAQLFNQVESEHTKLATILTEIDEPVLVTAESGEIMVANAAFRTIFGLEPGEDISGQPLDAVVFNPALQKFVAADAPQNESHKDEILLSDGRTFYATLTLVPNVGRAVVMKDVTHFKELDRLKTDFVSTVSHDLRVPLNSIRDYAEMLAQVGPVNQKQTRFVERITGGVNDLVALIDSLLDLSAIELGIDPTIVTLDLTQIVESLVAEYQEKAAHNQQQLVYHPPLGPVVVKGNPIRLKQVVSNLIDNALKYTPQTGQIAVLVQRGLDEVTFKVEDNGIGIPPADLPFVFDKFYRVKPSRQDSQIAGTGLGLAICKSVIEKYNGHIWAESRPGAGSTFSFTLPATANNSLHNQAQAGSPVSFS